MPVAVDYSVEPRSRAELRNLALQIRKAYHLGDQLYFPIVEMLDVFEVSLEGFSYSIVPDDTMPPNKHADINVYTREIRIKEYVYEGARAGNGRDRMTIAHEFSHYVTLCLCGYRLSRTVGSGKTKAYEDPEWQAKCLAGELLIPYDKTIRMSPSEISEKCGVSHEAAVYRTRF